MTWDFFFPKIVLHPFSCLNFSLNWVDQIEALTTSVDLIQNPQNLQL